MGQFIHITVKLTGKATKVASEERLEYALVPPARLDTLLDLIGTRRPALAAMLKSCRITINGAEAGAGHLLSEGDEVTITAAD